MPSKCYIRIHKEKVSNLKIAHHCIACKCTWPEVLSYWQIGRVLTVHSLPNDYGGLALLTGRWSWTASTGYLKGQAKWCFHSARTTTFSRYCSWLVRRPGFLGFLYSGGRGFPAVVFMGGCIVSDISRGARGGPNAEGLWANFVGAAQRSLHIFCLCHWMGRGKE